MKKTVFITSVISLLALASCKEHASLGINFGNSSTTLADTTYMASVETASDKKVVIEEFTGGYCSNCPAARELLATISGQNPGKLVLLELHPKEVPQGRPYPGAKYDFTNSHVSSILSLFYPGIPQVPIAGINRIVNSSSNNLFFNKGDWAATIQNQLGKKSVANIALTKVSYNDANREGVVQVKISYTSDVSTKQYITLGIIESNVVDIQLCADSVNHNYTFKHIYRKTETLAGGNVILDSMTTKKAGRVYQANFKYTIDPAWNPANCQLVVFLHNNESGNKEILQADEINVK